MKSPLLIVIKYPSQKVQNRTIFCLSKTPKKPGFLSGASTVAPT